MIDNQMIIDIGNNNDFAKINVFKMGDIFVYPILTSFSMAQNRLLLSYKGYLTNESSINRGHLSSTISNDESIHAAQEKLKRR
jgi:hypothetical protein